MKVSGTGIPRPAHLYLSARLLSLLGLAQRYLAHHRGRVAQAHPPGRPGSATGPTIVAHLRGETDHFESEYRVADKDGRFHWVLARGLAHRNQQGRAVRIVGSIGDITATQAAPKSSSRPSATFSRGLIDRPAGALLPLRPERGRLLLWNRFVSELTGLPDGAAPATPKPRAW
jgi:two-component system cell cycle sensor histidine kinase PleC